MIQLVVHEYLYYARKNVQKRFEIFKPSIYNAVSTVSTIEKFGYVQWAVLHSQVIVSGIINSRHPFLPQSIHSNSNRLFPSFLVPLFQSETKCETIHMKRTLICKSFALTLVLKENSEMAYWTEWSTIRE